MKNKKLLAVNAAAMPLWPSQKPVRLGKARWHALALLPWLGLAPALPSLAQTAPATGPRVSAPQSSQVPVLPEAVPRSLPELPPFSARSDLPPTLQLRLGQSVMRDNNVFRSPESAQLADTYGMTTLGLKLDKRYSLQRVELDVYAQNYQYQNFSELDFTALNYNAAWRWSATPRARGNLTADRREFVDNSADVLLDSGAIGAVNRRTESAVGLDAEYEVGAAWRAVAGVFQRDLENTRSTSEADVSVTGAEVGARYVLRSGNSLAYRFRSGDGKLKGRTGVDLPQDFMDTEHEVRIDWAPTGRSTVEARLVQLNREHETVPERDFSGLAGRLNTNWVLSGKTQVDAGFIRELVSYQSASTNYYEGDRIYISPVWRPTAKTALRLRFEQGNRNYKGAPAGQVSLGRRDKTELASLGVEWEALRALTVAATVQRDKRTSNVAGGEYSADTVGLSALFRF